MKDENREILMQFADHIFGFAESRSPVERIFPVMLKPERSYKPSDVVTARAVSGSLKTIVVTDYTDENGSVKGMVSRFRDSVTGDVKVINLNDLKINGGCLGCCECGLDYRCIYTGKDEFIDFYNREIKTADMVVFAGALKDRYLSAKFKEVFDRGFFNTHTPTLVGKQVAFMISGSLSESMFVRDIFHAYTEWQRANLAGIVTDESGNDELIDDLISGLAANMIKFAGSKFVKPATFLGVGGMKVFRDDIWGRLRFVFQADHDFYQKNGYYDFPQEDKKTQDINEKMIAMSNMPEMREKFRKMIKTEMVKPHRYIAENK